VFLPCRQRGRSSPLPAPRLCRARSGRARRHAGSMQLSSGCSAERDASSAARRACASTTPRSAASAASRCVRRRAAAAALDSSPPGRGERVRVRAVREAVRGLQGLCCGGTRARARAWPGEWRGGRARAPSQACRQQGPYPKQRVLPRRSKPRTVSGCHLGRAPTIELQLGGRASSCDGRVGGGLRKGCRRRLRVHVRDQAAAEGCRVRQRGRRLLVEHAHKHARHHELALPRAGSPGASPLAQRRTRTQARARCRQRPLPPPPPPLGPPPLTTERPACGATGLRLQVAVGGSRWVSGRVGGWVGGWAAPCGWAGGCVAVRRLSPGNPSSKTQPAPPGRSHIQTAR